jgi:phage gpG-like protein
MGVTVNVAEWDAVKRSMQRASQGAFLAQLAARMAATMTKLLADEFRQSRDPYGVPWKSVFRNRKKDRAARARAYKRASRSGKALSSVRDRPLIDTGRLRAAAVARTSVHSGATNVRVIIPVAYATYHQEGTGHMVRRQIVPDAKTGGLGHIWSAALSKESKAVLAGLGKVP